jgi:hypothetical protein
MLPEKPTSFQAYIGRYLFHWMIVKAGMWFLIYKCVDSMVQVHGPVDEMLRLLDRILEQDQEDDNPDDGVENNENGPLDWVFRASHRWRSVRRAG